MGMKKWRSNIVSVFSPECDCMRYCVCGLRVRSLVKSLLLPLSTSERTCPGRFLRHGYTWTKI